MKKETYLILQKERNNKLPRKKSISKTSGEEAPLLYLYALDISLTNTGITIYNLQTKKFILVTHISTDHLPKSYDHGAKLKYIADEFLKIREQYPPSVVVAERGFSHPKRPASTQSIYRATGLLNYLLYDFKFTYYPPKTVKEAICKGDATKELLQKVIKIQYPEQEFHDTDESDSFAVALTYLIKNDLIEWNKAEILRKFALQSKTRTRRKKKEE